MAYWWTGRNDERYWCEITDREDLGANLWCPQADESGKPYWSYSLIKEVAQGDIVFHYATPERAFVAASVACGVLEECEVVWVPHGTVGRANEAERAPRPGWRLPLTGMRRARRPLRLAELNAPGEREWLEGWVKDISTTSGSRMIPIQLYPGKLRGNQGYLTKMPRDFVERWAPLSEMVESLSRLQDDLTLDDTSRFPGSTPGAFQPKSSEPYSVTVRAGQRLQSRNHEKLVAALGAAFIPMGAHLETTRHPIDVLMQSPSAVIIEAKTVGSRHPGHAVREAVGQLLEYRHFVGPRDADLCIALDAEPDADIVSYVEEVLNMLLIWTAGGGVHGGPRTASTLASLGMDLRAAVKRL